LQMSKETGELAGIVLDKFFLHILGSERYSIQAISRSIFGVMYNVMYNVMQEREVIDSTVALKCSSVYTTALCIRRTRKRLSHAALYCKG
jgi:hypothetical protein